MDFIPFSVHLQSNQVNIRPATTDPRHLLSPLSSFNFQSKKDQLPLKIRNLFKKKSSYFLEHTDTNYLEIFSLKTFYSALDLESHLINLIKEKSNSGQKIIFNHTNEETFFYGLMQGHLHSVIYVLDKIIEFYSKFCHLTLFTKREGNCITLSFYILYLLEDHTSTKEDHLFFGQHLLTSHEGYPLWIKILKENNVFIHFDDNGIIKILFKNIIPKYKIPVIKIGTSMPVHHPRYHDFYERLLTISYNWDLDFKIFPQEYDHVLLYVVEREEDAKGLLSLALTSSYEEVETVFRRLLKLLIF